MAIIIFAKLLLLYLQNVYCFIYRVAIIIIIIITNENRYFTWYLFVPPTSMNDYKGNS